MSISPMEKKVLKKTDRTANISSNFLDSQVEPKTLRSTRNRDKIRIDKRFAQTTDANKTFVDSKDLQDEELVDKKLKNHTRMPFVMRQTVSPPNLIPAIKLPKVELKKPISLNNTRQTSKDKLEPVKAI
jgi:hypothetical protein